MRITNKVTFMTKPGCITQLKDLLSKLVMPAKKDNGCVHFDIFHDQENPIKFFLVETWENDISYEAHKNTQHYKDFDKEYLEFAEGKYIMELELLGC